MSAGRARIATCVECRSGFVTRTVAAMYCPPCRTVAQREYRARHRRQKVDAAGLPAEWVVKRRLTGLDAELRRLGGPSPCWSCIWLDACRARIKEPVMPPCFTGEAADA